MPVPRFAALTTCALSDVVNLPNENLERSQRGCGAQ
jgi:hypothetical protein